MLALLDMTLLNFNRVLFESFLSFPILMCAATRDPIALLMQRAVNEVIIYTLAATPSFRH